MHAQAPLQHKGAEEGVMMEVGKERMHIRGGVW